MCFVLIYSYIGYINFFKGGGIFKLVNNIYENEDFFCKDLERKIEII